MILHVVLFRFKPGVTTERIAQAGEALLGMQAGIPEIRAIRWGANLGPSAGEYSHVLTVSLDDMPAVDRYLDHPVHRRVISQHIAEIREARLALDIEA